MGTIYNTAKSFKELFSTERCQLAQALRAIEIKKEEISIKTVELEMWTNRANELGKSLIYEPVFTYKVCCEIADFAHISKTAERYKPAKYLVELYKKTFLPADATDIRHTVILGQGLETTFIFKDTMYGIHKYTRESVDLGPYYGEIILYQVDQDTVPTFTELYHDYDPEKIKEFLINKHTPTIPA